MFYVGQKVVCVDDSPSKYTGRSSVGFLVKDAIYTVTKYFYNWDTPVVYLAETTTDEYHNGFVASRFRPLQERKNDGEAFVRKLKEDCMPKEIERV